VVSSSGGRPLRNRSARRRRRKEWRAGSPFQPHTEHLRRLACVRPSRCSRWVSGRCGLHRRTCTRIRRVPVIGNSSPRIECQCSKICRPGSSLLKSSPRPGSLAYVSSIMKNDPRHWAASHSGKRINGLISLVPTRRSPLSWPRAPRGQRPVT
jgi:hypothetical protein